MIFFSVDIFSSDVESLFSSFSLPNPCSSPLPFIFPLLLQVVGHHCALSVLEEGDLPPRVDLERL